MSARVFDRNGWFEIPANPLSKAGVFNYKGASIRAPNPDAIYRVYRPASELADPDTIDSFRLVPFVIDHMMLGDPEKLNEPGFIPPELKGVHGVIGDKVFFNPDDETLYGNLKIFSASAPKEMAKGKIDLSLGYRCLYIEEPGTAPDGTPYDYVQRKMRGNHVALVDDGRCGDDVSVMDHSIFTFDAKDLVPMVERLKKRNAVAFKAICKSLVSGYMARAVGKRVIPSLKISAYAMDAADEEAVSSEPALSDVADILGDVLPQIAEINAAIADAGAGGGDDMEPEMEPEMDADGMPVMDGDKPKMKPAMDADGKPKMKKKAAPAVAAPAVDATAMDAAIAKAVKAAVAPLNSKIAALESGGMKAILGEISKRNELAGKLSNFVGTFDHNEMTLAEVAKYGVKKLEIPTTDGQEISAITAWLHNRPLPNKAIAGTGQDGNDKSTSIDNYLSPKAA